ncbi:MAG: hypothetical protein ACKVS6_05615 [Planctomycetota bacterium]
MRFAFEFITVLALPFALVCLQTGSNSDSKQSEVLPLAAPCDASADGTVTTVDTGRDPAPAAEPGLVEPACANCPSGCEQEEITGASLATLQKRIDEIDRAFVANDFQLFSRVLGGGDSAQRRQLECHFKTGIENVICLSRQTTILKAIRLCNTDAVYTKIETVQRPKVAKSEDWLFDRKQSQSLVLFFSWSSKSKNNNSAPVLARMERFDLDAAEILDIGQTAPIGCKPCGWSMERPKGWFLVPRVAGEGAALDALSFIHPTLKISIDFDSFANANILCPLMMAERDHDILALMLRSKPESVKILKKTALMEGNLVRADLIADFAGAEKSSETLRLHRCYRSNRPFLYSLVARGEAREMAGHTLEIHSVFDSIRFVNDKDRPSGAAPDFGEVHAGAARSERGHLLDQTLGVIMDPPAGWIATEQPGVGRFCIKFAPANDKNITLTAFAWDGDARCYGEQEVARFFENRRSQMPKKEYINWSVLRREVIDHPNGVDVCFEVESQWQSGAEATKDQTIRELFVAIPTGRYLCGFVARAPAGQFEQYKETFLASIQSFRHSVGK